MTKEPKLPSSAPVGLLLASLFALIATVIVFLVWLYTSSPLRSFYVATYLKTSLPTFQIGKHRKLVAYKVLMSGAYPAVAGSSLTGAHVGQHYSYPKEFHAWLQHFIYDGESTVAILLWPLGISGALFAVALIPAVIYDSRHGLIRRSGLKIRGPKMYTVAEFNKTVKGDGLTFLVVERIDR